MSRRIHYYEHREPELGDTSKLSPRQREVVFHMRRGLSNVEIAEEMGISLETVNSHVEKLKDRFSALNKIDLICQMWLHGILERPRMMSLVACLLCTLAAMPTARTNVRPAPSGRAKTVQVVIAARHNMGVLTA